MLKFSTLFFVLVTLSTLGKAQTGCVRNALLTRIYTTIQSGSNYKATPFTDAAIGCQYVQTGTACTVTGLGGGIKGTVGVVTCPIDSNIWLMMTVLGGVGFIAIRKLNAFKTSSFELVAL